MITLGRRHCATGPQNPENNIYRAEYVRTLTKGRPPPTPPPPRDCLNFGSIVVRPNRRAGTKDSPLPSSACQIPFSSSHHGSSRTSLPIPSVRGTFACTRTATSKSVSCWCIDTLQAHIPRASWREHPDFPPHLSKSKRSCEVLQRQSRSSMTTKSPVCAASGTTLEQQIPRRSAKQHAQVPLPIDVINEALDTHSISYSPEATRPPNPCYNPRKSPFMAWEKYIRHRQLDLPAHVPLLSGTAKPGRW